MLAIHAKVWYIKYNETGSKRKEIKMKNEVREMIKMIEKAYIEVMGAEKWNSLTDKEKHDAVMIIATDAARALN